MTSVNKVLDKINKLYLYIMSYYNIHNRDINLDANTSALQAKYVALVILFIICIDYKKKCMTDKIQYFYANRLFILNQCKRRFLVKHEYIFGSFFTK